MAKKTLSIVPDAPAEAEKPKRTGRPRAEVNWKLVQNFAAAHCTAEEIGAFLGLDAKTLENACKREHKISFSEYLSNNRLVGLLSLRSKRYAKAMKGDNTMLLQLCKVWLKERDELDITHRGASDEPVVVEMIVTRGDGQQVERGTVAPVDAADPAAEG